MIVDEVSLRNIRSYARLDLELEAGLVLVTGANGAGKTNLLESLHVGTQGFSPRTRTDVQLVRLGESAGRIVLQGMRDRSQVQVEVTVTVGEGKRARLNGAAVSTADLLRTEMATLAFTPDRLAIVKGGPAVRRAYFDRVVARLFPARAPVPVDYAAALAQRNASLRRVASGFGTSASIEPWTEQVVMFGSALVEARTDAIQVLAPRFTSCAAELALPSAELSYEPAPVTAEIFEARLERDLERGTTGAGPHLDDILLSSEGRDLRSFGSQGEQRLAVLALILAEAEAIIERRGYPPLLLLDDVLSELDPDRRRALASRVTGAGQTLVTSTTAAALPLEPAQLLEVTPGEVHAR